MLDGVHELSREDYDNLSERVNWSKLKWLFKSPAHYRHALLSKQEDTDAMRLGRVVHLAAFEPERFRSSIAVWDGGVRRGKDWEQFKSRHEREGHELLTENQYETCMDIQAAVRAHPLAMKYIQGGVGERSVLWTYKSPAFEGLPGYSTEIKSRLDFISSMAICDLKTTADASPAKFLRQLLSMHYHTQAAIYSDGYAAASGVRLPYFIVATEVTAPHVTQVYRISERLLMKGRDEYRGLLDTLAVCRRESRWLGYGDDVIELDLPDSDEAASDFGLEIGASDAA